MAKLVIYIDGCWRSLAELQEEGRVLKFAVLRDGHIKMLTRPPKASNVVIGKPLHYRTVKRRKKTSHVKENIGNNEEDVRNRDWTENLCNSEKNETVSSSHSEELVINIEENHLLMIRRFFLTTPFYKIDVNRFDKDKVYRQATLYRFQPVVQVDRLLPRLHHQLTPSLRSNSRTSFQMKTTSTAANSSGKISKPARRRRSPVKIRKSSVRPGREYSSLEDHAIVSWLSASREREHAVNGNRVWRELEQHHARLTGQERSWHSLRNRYLRYILPALSLLALSPSHAQRLRAAAATGEIKKRKQRRASILHEPAVRSAHAPHARARLAPRTSLTLSDESDGILHENVRRPSIQPKKPSAPVKKPQEEKSKSQSGNPAKLRNRRKSSFRTKSRSRSPSPRLEANEFKNGSRASDSDEVQMRGSRKSLRKRKSSFLETPEESTAKKSKKQNHKSESDKVKLTEPIRQSKSKEFSSRSPLKRIQMEKPKNWSEHSDSDEEISKKKAPKKCRDSEDSDSEGETRERSRLRPRLQNLSDNSDDDNTYAPTSPQKKRRKLFNPFA